MPAITEVMKRTDYKSLSFRGKEKYHGKGYVTQALRPPDKRGRHYRRDGGSIKRNMTGRYRHADNCWRMEWSSGDYSTKSPRKVLYRSLTVWGEREDARKLLDIIVSVPHRTNAEAEEAIKPYIQWESHANQGSPPRRVIHGPIPDSPLTSQTIRRSQIELDYWRMRILDTIEAYRRFDDDY